jgi:glycosyltransferase involved in cell wall biosynthesis
MTTHVPERNDVTQKSEASPLLNVKPNIAVLIPCFNEEATIQAVIQGFRRFLPEATIYVYDNNSTDNTAAIASESGAVVRQERYQGKGNVMRRMFADIEADVYLLTDGDLTYDMSAANVLIQTLISKNADMVVGVRVESNESAYRPGHRFGNRLFTKTVALLFGEALTDILSGYRAMSRRFVKSFPASSSGFETETELSIHALDLRLATVEVPLPYGERPIGSASKLRTYRDGMRILMTIIMMYRALHPFQFYGVIALCLFILALALGVPLVITYLETGLVPRFPTAILAAGIIQIGFLSLACGLVIEAISSTRRELKRMRYLDLPSPDNR